MEHSVQLSRPSPSAHHDFVGSLLPLGSLSATGGPLQTNDPPPRRQPTPTHRYPLRASFGLPESFWPRSGVWL